MVEKGVEGTVWPRGPHFVECVLPPHSQPAIVLSIHVGVGLPIMLLIRFPALLLEVHCVVVAIL